MHYKLIGLPMHYSDLIKYKTKMNMVGISLTSTNHHKPAWKFMLLYAGFL